LPDPGMGGIILRWNLKGRECGLNSSGPLVGSCEHCNEPWVP